MGINIFSCGVLLTVTVSCHAAAVGVVSVSSKGETQVHTLSQLAPDDTVQIQYLDSSGKTRCCASLEGRSFVPIAAIPTVSNALTGDSLFSYRLRASPSDMHGRPFVGVALIGAREVKDIGPRALQVDFGNGLLSVKTCTSQEGLHVIAEANHKLLEDLYWGFDYDVSHPTCH